MIINKYPYTDFHELNLDWILGQMKKLESDYSGLVAGYEQIEKDFKTLEGTVNNLLNVMEDEIKEAINTYLPIAMAPYIQELNNGLAQIADLRDQMADWDEELQQIRREYTTADESLKIDYLNRIASLRFEMLQQIIRLDNRIDDLEFNLPEIYNLVKGYKTDIASVIYDVYDACRYFAYTAVQFANAGLTAQELDDLNREALELDLNGYVILYPPKQCLNPLTGVRADICSILQDLALFASTRTWTALIWDNTWEQDVDTIDALDITAFNFDYTDDANPNP